MKIQLLISTYNEGILRVAKVLLPPMDGLSYLVSHQYTCEDCLPIPQSLLREDVIISQILSAGISVNRNNSIKCASGDIVVLLDDDVRLKTEYIESLKTLFETHPEVDVACCKIKTFAGEPEYKVYPEQEKLLQNIGALKAVSSIEISFRLRSVRDKGIWFDERFGLGTTVKSGEELLFLNACIKKGLNIRYFPIYTVEHSYLSTTKNQSAFSDERLFATGAQAYVLYGKMAFLRNFFAVFRRFGTLRKENISALHFIKMKQAGSMHILRGEKK